MAIANDKESNKFPFLSQGGLKAVVWSEFFQSLLFLGCLSTIAAKGIIDAGGISEVWNVSTTSGRILWADWDPSPFARTTTWTAFAGQFVVWSAVFGCHQAQFQRMCATRTVARARG